MSVDPQVNTIAQIVTDLKTLYDNNPNNQIIRNAVRTGLNKALGQVFAAKHEISPIVKALRDGRKVGGQKYRDVHVGHKTDAFAKTIELKSKSDARPGAVDAELSKAFQQMFSDNKAPRPGDIWVVDMLISNPLNRWPYPTDNQARQAKDEQLFINTAKSRIMSSLRPRINNRFLSYINLKLTELQDHYNDMPIDREHFSTTSGMLWGGRSTRPVAFYYNHDKHRTSKVLYLNALTIKIRYAPGMLYPLTTGQSVEQIVFQVKSQDYEVTRANVPLALVSIKKV